jgi:hypothetical protein
MLLKKSLFFAIFVSLTFTAPRMFAAGGSCPTGANYGPNGNQTLAAIGVTSCFYAALNGSDSNSGTSESSPWAHVPGQAGCSGTCASTTPGAGQGFIMRGGDIWTNTSLPLTWTWSGTSANPSYIGVDRSWYSGGSWNRPVFDSLKNSISGAYFANFNGSQWAILDNIEMRSMTDSHGAYVACSDNCPSDVFENLYLHAQNVALDGSCTFYAGAGSNPSPTVLNNVMDGSDRTGATNVGGNTGTCYAFYPSIPNIKNSVIHDLANGIVGHSDATIEVSGNLIYNIVFSNNGSHPNGYEVGDDSTHYFHDNVLHDTNGEMYILSPTAGNSEKDYTWNNVFYNIIGNPPEIGVASPSVGLWYNNTIANTCPVKTGSCSESSLVCFSGPFASSQILTNNYCVSGSLGAGGATLTSNLQQSSAAADANASPSFELYSVSQAFAYSPTASTNPTVGAGVNLTSSWPSGYPTSDTTYACTQQSINGVVQSVCPARKSLARPSNGAWDSGAYQFSPGPPSPGNLQATPASKSGS